MIFFRKSDIHIMMFMHLRFHLLGICVCTALVLCIGNKPCPNFWASAVLTGQKPIPYLVEKANQGKLLLIGTRHDNIDMHNIITDSLPMLVKEAGVNTLFLEIPSSQQMNINRFLDGNAELQEIGMWKIISSDAYCNILCKARELGMNVVAMDNDEDPCIPRDKWMAMRVSGCLKADPSIRGMIVVGNCHILKNIKWALREGQSLADYLNNYKTFSVLMWQGDFDSSCPLALDIDPVIFHGVKDPTLKSLNLRPQISLSETADGVIFLPSPVKGNI